jgi:hypothetical protein
MTTKRPALLTVAALVAGPDQRLLAGYIPRRKCRP